MDHVDSLVRIGGVLCVLVFVHFVVDWVFQSHAEAMKKHDHAWVRARHCAIYTTPFVPLMVWAHVPLAWTAVGAATLFFSHFVEDTYLPVYLWARFIRRPPEMQGRPREIIEAEIADVLRAVRAADLGDVDAARARVEALRTEIRWTSGEKAWVGFLPFVSTPLGKILMIAVDQIIHVAFLVPIAWIIVAFGR